MNTNSVRRRMHGRLFRTAALLAVMLIALLSTGPVSNLDASALRQGELPTIRIEANRADYVVGLGDLAFTLTRGGDAAAEAEALVKLDQEFEWIAENTHNVSFEAGASEATLTFRDVELTTKEATSGNLIATLAPVAGYNVDDAMAAVNVISLSGPAVRVSLEGTSFTFNEGAGETSIGLVARSEPGLPYLVEFLAIIFTFDEEGVGAAQSPGDYVPFTKLISFSPEDFSSDGDGMTARAAVTVTIVDDNVYEGNEHFGLQLATSQDYAPVIGLLDPNGQLCVLICDNAHPATIVDNDPKPSFTLSANNARILELGGATSTVTAAYASGAMFADDEPITFTFSGPATPGVDFALSPEDADTVAGHQLLLKQGQTSVGLVIAAVADGLVDRGEWVLIEASIGPDGAPIDSGTVIVIDDDEQNALSGATPLGVGLEHERTGELTADDGGSDVYSFYGVSGEEYIIEVKVPLSHLDENGYVRLGGSSALPGYIVDPSILEVLDHNGNRLMGEHDEGGFTLNWARAFFTAPVDGVFQIVVGAGGNDRTGLGAYTVSVRIDNHADDYSTDPDVALTPNTAATGSIDSDVHPLDPRLNAWDWVGREDEAEPRRGIESLDDRDVFRINITEAGEYEILVNNQPTGIGILYLWDHQGNLYWASGPELTQRFAGSLDPGTYYVEIGTPYKSYGNTGSFEVLLQTVSGN